MRCFLLRLLLPGLALVAALPGAVPGLKVGAGRADITPAPELLNWVTGKPYGVVHDPLSVQVLVLDDGTRKAAIVRWDLVDVSESARDEVRRVLGGALGISADLVIVHASHNHSAPWAPSYRTGYRGEERDTWWSIRYMPGQYDHPPYRRWMQRLLDASVEAAQHAAAAAAPVSMAIARIAVPEFLYNRRVRAPAWGMADPKGRTIMINGKGDWVPEVLVGGSTFGPMDRTFSLLLFRDPAGGAVASLYHLACHPVAVYPEDPNRISADWPAYATREIGAVLGGENLFLQGCAGDITPSWARGVEASKAAAKGLAKKAELAARYAALLVPGALQGARTSVELPLTPEAQARLKARAVTAEVQVVTCGPVAFVALPGEPLTDLGTAIRENSPFPQTLVLGYSNGNGVHYVGMPGEKARGGYEAGRAGAGTDECGALLVEAARRLLRDLAPPRP